MQNHVYKNITNFKPKNPKELLFYANFFTFKRFFTTNKILFSPLPANNPSGTTNSTKILTQNISSGLTGPIQSNLTNSTITLSTGINKCMTSVKPSSILNSPTKKPLVLPNNKYTIKVSDKALGPRNKGDFLIPYLAVRATKPIETEDGYFIDQKHAIIIREDEYYDHQKKTLELITASTTIPSSYVTALQNNSLRIDKQDKNQFFNFTEVYRKDFMPNHSLIDPYTVQGLAIDDIITKKEYHHLAEEVAKNRKEWLSSPINNTQKNNQNAKSTP